MRSSKVCAILLLVFSVHCGPMLVQCSRGRKNCDAKTQKQLANLVNMIQQIGENVADLQLDLTKIESDLSGLEHVKNSLAEQRCLLTSRQCVERLTGCGCCETKCQDRCRIPESNYSYCCDIKCKDTGIYLIQPEKPFKQPMAVLCDQDYESGGWTVIQYRFDGSVNFYRGWEEYKNGFGSLEGEFWLGLDRIHQLTASKPHELVVLLERIDGVSSYARYDRFEIGDESQQYVLKSVGTHSGTAPDQLTDLIGQRFSTLDYDYDNIYENCAVEYTGAWWHKDCYFSNLNGQYIPVPRTEYGTTQIIGIIWDQPNALKFSKMMIRCIP